MTNIKTIVKEFKTPPVVVKSATVKPAEVTRVQSRADIKKKMANGFAPPPRQSA